MAECDKSPTGQHDPHYTGTSVSTCMAGPYNSGSDSVRCSWCGRPGRQLWHEATRQIKGRGPYATRIVRVIDDTQWRNTGGPDA